MSQSFTQTVLQSNPEGFKRATQPNFLRNAACGLVDKATLGSWLANDRLYIHGYIRATGHLLSFLSLPAEASTKPSDGASRLLSWCIDALVNIRREEAFFVQTAADYGIGINLPITNGVVAQADKLPGLVLIEKLFDSVKPGQGPLPWLEAAVLFYGTEKCYLEAWTWAKSQQINSLTEHADLDGGALRKQFIPNWTAAEFVKFVDELAKVIDDAVEEAGEGEREGLMERAEATWEALLLAEESFWPVME